MALSLKELLLRDWGTDLPIEGGAGQSREEPIVITATDALAVAEAEMLTLRGIGQGREVYWHTLGQDLLGPEWPGLKYLRIETARLTDDEIITTIERYYFDISASLRVSSEGWQETKLISYAATNGLNSPFEIGWLHFNTLTDNEPTEPGLGVALNYSGPAVNATIYIYDRGRRDVPENLSDAWLQQEFESALSSIKEIRSDVSPWPEPPPNPAFRVCYLCLGPEAERATALWMTTAKGKIIKCRATWERDRFLDDVADGFLKSLLWG